MELQLNDSLLNSITEADKETEIYDSKVSGLAIRIYPSGTKSFVYRFRFNGQSKRFTIGKHPSISVSKARDTAKDLYAKVRLGINPISEKRQKIEKQKSPSFRKLKNEYIAKHIPTMKESTATEFKRIIEKELSSLFPYKLNQITKKQILKILDDKAYRQKHPTQANQIKIVLSSMYSFGVSRDFIESNPILSIPTYKSGVNQRNRFYSEPEIQSIWKEINQMPSPTKQAFQILFLLGQRKGETLKMKRTDIDHTNRVWIIPPYIAKNKTEHHIPIPTYAYSILKGLESKSEYVFNSPVKPNHPIQSIKRQTKNVKDNSGVTDFRVHDIRRTVATHLAKLGTDRTTIGKILNHKGLAGDNSVTAIYDRYNYSKEKRKALDQWEKQLLSIIK